MIRILLKNGKVETFFYSIIFNNKKISGTQGRDEAICILVVLIQYQFDTTNSITKLSEVTIIGLIRAVSF